MSRISPTKYTELGLQRIMNADETELPLDGSKRAGYHSVNNVLFD